MAFRFASAALCGLAAGGWNYANRIHAAEMPGNRSGYGVNADNVALDVKEELEAARKLQRSREQPDDKKKRFRGPLNLHFQPFKLGEVINLTEETAIFRFLMPDIDDEFWLEPCSTLQVQKKDGAMMIEHLQRMYTPISPCGTRGYFDILVKKQPHGRMTEHMWSMRIGDALNFRIVLHKLKYLPNVYENIGMVGTGTGVTSLLQVIRASLSDPEDRTKLSLLFANPSDQRVLLKGSLDALQKESKGRFKLHYTVDKVVGEDPWNGFVGYIDREMLKKTMPPPGPKNIILVCGSDQLLNSVCGTPFAVLKPWSSGHSLQPAASHGASNLGDALGGHLGDLGYTSEHVYRF